MVHKINAYGDFVQQQSSIRLQRQFNLMQETSQRYVQTLQRNAAELRSNSSYSPAVESSTDCGFRFTAWVIAQSVVTVIVLPSTGCMCLPDVATTITWSILGCFGITSGIGCCCYDPIKSSLSEATCCCSSSRSSTLDAFESAPIVQKTQSEPASSESKPLNQSKIACPIVISTKPHSTNPYLVSTTINTSKLLTEQDILTTSLSKKSTTATSPTKDFTFTFRKEPGSLDLLCIEALRGATPIAVDPNKITHAVKYIFNKLITKNAPKYQATIQNLSHFSVTIDQSSLKIESGDVVIHLKKLEQQTVALFLNSIQAPQIQGQ